MSTIRKHWKWYNARSIQEWESLIEDRRILTRIRIFFKWWH